MTDTQITLKHLSAMKAEGDKIASLTCYDAAFARVLERAGVEVLLVGDSLGNVLQGHAGTIPVSVTDMAYHSACVARAHRSSLLVVDMPFLSYADPGRALDTAAELMQRGGAQMVKLEGGAVQLETVRRLSGQGVPVCGHLGLLPQSVHKEGGYRVHGRDERSAATIHRDALSLQEAGASMLVLECVPVALGRRIARDLEMPVIGIGAGPDCDGQVLVLHDLLGVTPFEGAPPRFVRNFMGEGGIEGAVRAYVRAVKNGEFPAPEHCFE